VQQAQTLAKNGVKELMVIAQDSTYYGLDIYKERKLGELLQRLSEVNGIEWIRLHYAFPSGFPEDVLDVMRRNEKVCRYIDMPLQHISDRMLASMKRGTTKQKTIDLVNRIRDKVPGIAVRTTLITGYPGETEKDHEEMLQWVSESRFDRLGVFTYSHEENTSAFLLKDDVPAEVKQQRAEAVMELQQGISLELNQQKIGKQFRVLIDRKEGGSYYGRTEFDSPEVDNEVLIDSKEHFLRIGDFVPVSIISAEDYDLFGTPLP
jgi:ribosomal protein S12 methylthiotransferase